MRASAFLLFGSGVMAVPALVQESGDYSISNTLPAGHKLANTLPAGHKIAYTLPAGHKIADGITVRNEDMAINHTRAKTNPDSSPITTLNSHMKRQQFVECWLSGADNQGGYEEDCRELSMALQDLAVKLDTARIGQGQSIVYTGPKSLCKLVIRNQSNCVTESVKKGQLGQAVEMAMGSCNYDGERSGWGTFNAHLVFIVEANGVGTPWYDQNCGS